jgi:uncharacterized protein (TIGR02145 family)
MDFDGIYDSVDDCVGAYDECGVCNGPGPQILGIDTIIVYYDSLYAEAIDEWWVFEVDADTLLGYYCENPGCMDPTADNFDPYAIEEDGSCTYPNGGPSCDYASTIFFDGHYYPLAGIGSQCWFAENLQTEHYSNGDPIPGNLSNSEWSNTHETSLGAQAIYNNDPENLAGLGRLYNFFAVSDDRGICPVGWHVPSDGEFRTLEIELGMEPSATTSYEYRGTDQGTQLKSAPGDTPAWDGTNTSAFSAVPGGERTNGGQFIDSGNHGLFWLAPPDDAHAFWRTLSTGNPGVYRAGVLANSHSRRGFSVRCVKD